MRIDEYEMVIDVSADDIGKQIDAMICEGWQPYGNPFACESYFCQAMVKYEDAAYRAMMVAAEGAI